MTPLEIEKTLNEIFGLYEKHGAEEYIGEPVSQLEHMSQTAALAIQSGFDDEVVIAAFFHDIGHMCVDRSPENDLHGLGTISHEKVGADFLRQRGFPERVALLVENHVQAKRYLTNRFPEYYEKLSEASKKTLEYQGGRMTEDEANKFEGETLFPLYIQMRQWDELAKEIDQPIVSLIELRQRAKKILMAYHS